MQKHAVLLTNGDWSAPFFFATLGSARLSIISGALCYCTGASCCNNKRAPTDEGASDWRSGNAYQFINYQIHQYKQLYVLTIVFCLPGMTYCTMIGERGAWFQLIICTLTVNLHHSAN